MVSTNSHMYSALGDMQQKLLEQVTSAFLVSDKQLERVVNLMVDDLKADESRNNGSECASIKAMPSATHGITPGTALGMAIDASGKRIRISSTHFTDIDGGEQKSKRSSATQVFIPQARAKRSTADFFEFVAYCIREYIHTQGLVESKGNVALIPLGVSIGLPVSRQNGQPLGQDMCSPLSCTVAEVSKEDSLDLGDRDVARHLYDAILRNHLPVRIASVTNNVVSSLVAAQFNNKTTRVAASFNHGINAAYIKRHPDNQNSDDRLVAVNTEIGRFGSAPESLAVLPMTLWDNRIDRESRNPGARRFEKLVADQYLGEIVRNLITDFMDQHLLFTVSCDVSKINESYSFHTAYMAPIMEDTSSDLSSVGDLFKTVFGIPAELADRQIVRALCGCVASRAAKLSGAALAALVTRSKLTTKSCTVALGGVLLNSKPIFRTTLATMYQQLSNDKSAEVYLQPRHSDLLGAALNAVRLSLYC